MSKLWNRTSATGVASLVILCLAACSSVHEPALTTAIDRGITAAVSAQIAYAKDHYKNPNRSEFGDLGGTDCVNFTSQTLIARGWSMTDEWKFDATAAEPYTRPWISSTGFRDYLVGHPELASALSWSQRDKVQPGDIVQFDWDNSGDRDHTAVVSGVTHDAVTGERLLLVASHSPGAFDWPIRDVLAENSPSTKVYFWHLAE
jgi:hypothetical protein